MTVSARQRAEQLVRVETMAFCACYEDVLAPPEHEDASCPEPMHVTKTFVGSDLLMEDLDAGVAHERADEVRTAIQSAIEEAEREARIRGWTEGRDAAALVLDEVQRVAEKAAAYSRERLDFPARDQHDFRACDAEEAAARIRSLTPPMGQEMP